MLSIKTADSGFQRLISSMDGLYHCCWAVGEGGVN